METKNTKKNALPSNKAARAKYLGEHNVIIGFSLMRGKDDDVIEFVKNLPKKADFLREIVREKISKNMIQVNESL